MMQTLARLFTNGSGGAPKQRGIGAQLPAMPPHWSSAVQLRFVSVRHTLPAAGPNAHSPGVLSGLARSASVSPVQASASSVSVVPPTCCFDG
jgi:hypothetical protein